MKYLKLTLLLSIIILLISSCKKEKETTPIEDTHSINTITDLRISDDFDYQTSKRVTVSFSDASRQISANKVKYEVYLYDIENSTETVTYLDESGKMVTATIPVFDMQNNKIASVISDNNSFSLDLTIPSHYKKLYIVRNEMGIYSTSIIQVNQDRAVYKRTVENRSINGIEDIFYAVNSLGDLLTINQSTGEIVKVSDLPDNAGSWACAIDPISRKLYTISCTNSVGYKLYCYDIDNNTWETKGSLNITGPRLGYNKADGMLYFSTNNYVYIIDPSNANIISSYTITGLQSTSGGDLTFAEDGTMYLSSTTGLYKCDFGDGNTINTTWISSESLPNYPNSLTFDSNGQLWWATNQTVNNTHGRIFIMDTKTGSWESRFDPYTYYIHDLATLPYDESSVPETDSDGDGVIDFYDDYPNDGNKAATTYTPSIFGWGSYAFEDLWPYQGDYDFNDLVINYRYTNIENAAGLLVETNISLKIKNIGGSFKNGFGIELNMNENLISSVTGSNLTEGIIQVNTKGLEENQEKPVIIAFDNAWENNTGDAILELVIKYTMPIDPNNFSDLNPFIFINGDRGKEVHLIDKAPTNLANLAYFGTGKDQSNTSLGIYYRSDKNLPWAIDIIHDFVHPKENYEIILGYPFFIPWAESSGIDYTDWYKDKDGYRNTTYLSD